MAVVVGMTARNRAAGVMIPAMRVCVVVLATTRVVPSVVFPMIVEVRVNDPVSMPVSVAFLFLLLVEEEGSRRRTDHRPRPQSGYRDSYKQRNTCTRKSTHLIAPQSKSASGSMPGLTGSVTMSGLS